MLCELYCGCSGLSELDRKFVVVVDFVVDVVVVADVLDVVDALGVEPGVSIGIAVDTHIWPRTFSCDFFLNVLFVEDLLI